MNLYRNLAIGIVLAVIIVALGIIGLRKAQAPQSFQLENTPVSGGATGATTAPISGGSVTTSGKGTVKAVSTAPRAAQPDWHAPLVFSSSVSPDVQAALNAQFMATQKILAKDPTNFSAWLNLGIIRKTGGDYTGAAADWAYVTKIYPTSNIAFDDLGDLYANFLHDPAKAKANYEAALKLSPNDQIARQGIAGMGTNAQ